MYVAPHKRIEGVLFRTEGVIIPKKDHCCCCCWCTTAPYDVSLSLSLSLSLYESLYDFFKCKIFFKKIQVILNVLIERIKMLLISSLGDKKIYLQNLVKPEICLTSEPLTKSDMKSVARGYFRKYAS